jgi:hypothetical protein
MIFTAKIIRFDEKQIKWKLAKYNSFIQRLSLELNFINIEELQETQSLNFWNIELRYFEIIWNWEAGWVLT